MPSFEYRGVDVTGNAAGDVIEDATAAQALARLQEQGYTVYAIEELKKAGRANRRRLTWSDLDQFNQQLRMATRMGLPLAPAMKEMVRDLQDPHLKLAFDNVRTELEAGRTLEEALSRNGELFPPLYPAMVRAGEQTGNLAGVFDYLSGHSRSMMAMKTQLQAAMLYPLIVTGAAVALVVFILTKIVPVYVEIVNDFGGRLPWPTRFLWDLSGAISTKPIASPALLALLVGLVALLGYGFVKSAGRYLFLDRVRLRLPLFGKLLRLSALARLMRVLGILLKAEVPMTDSLVFAASAAGNKAMGHALLKSRDAVAAGSELAPALTLTQFFDRGFLWLIGTAERQGSLPDVILQMAADYEEAVERRRQWVQYTVISIVLVVQGGIIGFLLYAMYSPMFNIYG